MKWIQCRKVPESRHLFPSFNLDICGLRLGEPRAIFITPVIFGLVAYLSMAFALNCGAMTISPSNGIVLAALLLARRPSSPASIIAFSMIADAFAAAIVHRTLFASIGFPLIDAVEILTAFLILKSRERLPLRFGDVRSLMSFSMAAIAASAAAAILAGVTAPPLQNVDAHALFSLFVGHLLGLLTVTPALIRFLRKPKKAHQTPLRYERYGLLGLLVVLTAVVITSYQAPFGFVLLPILVTIAYRLGPRDTSAAVLLISTTVLLCTVLGFDPGAKIAPTALLGGTQLLQLRMLTTFLTVMLLAETIASQGPAPSATVDGIGSSF